MGCRWLTISRPPAGLFGFAERRRAPQMVPAASPGIFLSSSQGGSADKLKYSWSGLKVLSPQPAASGPCTLQGLLYDFQIRTKAWSGCDPGGGVSSAGDVPGARSKGPRASRAEGMLTQRARGRERGRRRGEEAFLPLKLCPAFCFGSFGFPSSGQKDGGKLEQPSPPVSSHFSSLAQPKAGELLGAEPRHHAC